MKNERHIPLFERILVVGLSLEDIRKSIKNIHNLSKIETKILEQYKANFLEETSNDNYIDNINIVKFIFTF